MGAKLWYRSCPAVSQISNFTVVSSRHTVCVRKAADGRRKKWLLIGLVAIIIKNKQDTNLQLYFLGIRETGL